MVAQFCAWYLNAKLIIDWHNFGFSILAMNTGKNSIPTKVATYYETWFGKNAYAHLCVTKAMAYVLKQEWKVKGKVVVLYDRAPKSFARLHLDQVHTVIILLFITFY